MGERAERRQSEVEGIKQRERRRKEVAEGGDLYFKKTTSFQLNFVVTKITTFSNNRQTAAENNIRRQFDGRKKCCH